MEPRRAEIRVAGTASSALFQKFCERPYADLGLAEPGLGEAFEVEMDGEAPHVGQAHLLETLQAGDDLDVDRHEVEERGQDEKNVHENLARTHRASNGTPSEFRFRASRGHQVGDDEHGDEDEEDDGNGRALREVVAPEGRVPHEKGRHVGGEGRARSRHRHHEVEDLERHVPQHDDRAQGYGADHGHDYPSVDLELGGAVHSRRLADLGWEAPQGREVQGHRVSRHLPGRGYDNRDHGEGNPDVGVSRGRPGPRGQAGFPAPIRALYRGCSDR